MNYRLADDGGGELAGENDKGRKQQLKFVSHFAIEVHLLTRLTKLLPIDRSDADLFESQLGKNVQHALRLTARALTLSWT